MQTISNSARPRTLGAPIGKLASESGVRLPLQVLQSAAGYYLGTFTDEGPYTRESAEYWPTREVAEARMTSGNWTQRDQL